MKLYPGFALSAALAAILPFGPAFAQDAAPPTVAEAPPVGAPAAPAAPAVYNWHDVPANTPVVITRGVFDQGGYQLYCETGETVVIPFENQNLYVMRFGRSEDAAMHFVNDGTAPMLLVPPGGYLENAAAQGARWFPFPPGYVYNGPVYMGVAPSYSEYVAMGWYPGMVYYGGYWGDRPYAVGISYSPIPGLYFSIYDHPYHGWNEYRGYYHEHGEGRIYERSYHNEYHYAEYRPRGEAFYRDHPDRGFAREHVAAEHRVEEHRAAEVHRADEHHAEGGNGFNRAHADGAKPGGFGAAHAEGAKPGGFGAARAEGAKPGAFGAAKSGGFGGAKPGGVAAAKPSGFGGAKPATGGFGGAKPAAGGFGSAKPGGFGSAKPGSTAFGAGSTAGKTSFGSGATAGKTSFGGSSTGTKFGSSASGASKSAPSTTNHPTATPSKSSQPKTSTPAKK